MNNRIDVLGIGFDNLTLPGAIDKAYSMTEQPGNHFVVTPNSEIVYMSRTDEKLKEILLKADLVVPDGIGVVKAAHMLKTPMKEKVAGIELGEGLIEKLSKTEKSIFLLGAKPGTAQTAADNLMVKYPGLKVAGVHDGYFKDDAPVIDEINASGAQVLFVCLGAPKQEYWMYENADKLDTRLMLGLGGSLDVFAGQIKRAPDFWIKLGLEWFYRLMKQPSRIGRMMALPKFMLEVKKYAKKKEERVRNNEW